MAIVDFHEFTEMAKDPASKKGLYLAMWEQIAPRCEHRPESVVFELLNEPNGELTPELWNEFLRDALAIVRHTNPNRTVIIGPAFWNGIGKLETLELPEDDREHLVTGPLLLADGVHAPGAHWSSHKDKSGITWNGTEAEMQAIAADFDKAQAWSKHASTAVSRASLGHTTPVIWQAGCDTRMR